MTDIEIAKSTKMEPIYKIAQKLNISNYIEQYGCYKAKINYNQIKQEKQGKLILVTSINPTPYGEGKTTVSIGLHDALSKLNKKSLAVLREPSLGPVFGIKGGATGGGYSQVVPMEDINLHVTGDFHAIPTANNLISAAIDNHIYFGNELEIDPKNICFRRCLDMNDRALRNVELAHHQEHFNITAASEIMSILCLSNDFKDLKNNLANILIAYNKEGKPIYAKDLKLTGSLAVILKDAIKPNLVQTLEHNPVIIHGGPFANISIGANSIIATKLGLSLADYVITEAGFGSDLGAEKFLDIKCRKANLAPNCIVIVATIKALKYNANVKKENIQDYNPQSLLKGLENLKVHIENMSKYTKNIVVALNQYATDTKEEIEIVKKFTNNMHVEFAVSNAYAKGGEGAISLANTVMKICDNKQDFKLLYDVNETIEEKIKTIATQIYHAKDIKYTKEATSKIKKLEELKLDKLPICIAKTQYSISDNPKLLGYPKDYEITIKDINIYTGAGFIVVYLASIMTMPGLSKHANYERIDIDDDYNIKGLF